MRRIVFAMMFALTIGVIASQASVAAQDATPIAPDPSLCTLTPPTIEELAMYAATPAAEAAASPEGTSSIELPAGDPVDDATRDAVEQSMIINVACQNTGSVLLQMATFTKEELALVVAGFGAITPEQYSSLATPGPVDDTGTLVILEFQDMVQLPDGRVAAIIVGDDLSNETEPPGPTLFFLREVDGHWYIDDFINPDTDS